MLGGRSKTGLRWHASDPRRDCPVACGTSSNVQHMQLLPAADLLKKQGAGHTESAPWMIHRTPIPWMLHCGPLRSQTSGDFCSGGLLGEGLTLQFNIA